MKPILVQNNNEWLRLAPVLDMFGYKWTNNNKAATSWNPYKEASWDDEWVIVIYMHGNSLSWSPSYPQYEEEKPQSVDEFIKIQPQQQ